MSSTSTVSPASLQKNRFSEPHDTTASSCYHPSAAVAGDSQYLSPYSSQTQSGEASPDASATTPTESKDTIRVYQAGEVEDPFFGVDFNNCAGDTPAFLDDDQSQCAESLRKPFAGHIPPLQYYIVDDADLPLSACKLPMQTGRDQEYHSGVSTGLLDPCLLHGSTHSLRSDTASHEPTPPAPQLTPDSNGGGWSSDDSFAPKHKSLNMASQSPRVTVSMWGEDREDSIHHNAERSFSPDHENPKSARPRASSDSILAHDTVYSPSLKVERDNQGRWSSDPASGHGGLAPGERPTAETSLSTNDLAKHRKIDKRNQEVAVWVSRSAHQENDGSIGEFDNFPYPSVNIQNADDENIAPEEIPMGRPTENKMIPGQIYYHIDSERGRMTQTDLHFMHQTRTWADAPCLPNIINDDSSRNQPESSQAAIDKFEKMCRDNDSIISHAATWGTRRRSLPSIIDVEGIVSGSFLKKLTIKSDSSTPRRPSLLKKIPDMVRRTSASQILKRKSSTAGMALPDDSQQTGRRGSQNGLSAPTSWSLRQKSMPSLNTAIVGMATGAASIGARHARSGSISATSNTSPKSPFAFQTVKSTLKRPRSKTEVPKGANPEAVSHPNIMGMLTKAGGPPVAQLARSQPMLDPDEDDDEDDETFDDSDMKIAGNDLEIIPTFDGFQQHILRLNPGLANPNRYLVDRIAHQMIVRFKNLQNLKIKHLKAVNSHKCMCGPLCIEQGGSSKTLDSRCDGRGMDPLSGRSASSDDDTTPIEGGISTESFPAGIPMPPTSILPAEIECQLCYSAKKFQKPSDWTKHVHEDVQPFTCTWDRCRDPKMFKRKADWVRHENEGHRHLEWWTCDVEDCRHTCYRRDNFLQHLVREHKFTEPKVKTKAAIKKAGGGDLTWQKVEKCHVETQNRPQDEPCRFCGKTFPTWKKLIVHLAKHMEHISLPVLNLVAAKNLREDTIISPVQDPPPRPFMSLPIPVKQEPQTYTPVQRPHALSNPTPMSYQETQSPYVGFQNFSNNQMQQSLSFNQRQAPMTAAHHFNALPHNQTSDLMMSRVTAGFNQPQYHTLPVTTGASFVGQPSNAYMSMHNNGLEPFPTFNALGLQGPDATGGQLGYDALRDVTMQGMEQYSQHGSVSPYLHSPQQRHNAFFHP